MRTTLTIDDDVIEVAQRIAKSRRISLGKAVSELARRGSAWQPKSKEVNGLIVFDLPSDSPMVTAELVNRSENASELPPSASS